MKQDEKKLEEKEKENDEIDRELDDLKKELEASANMSDEEKEQVANLIKAIGLKAKRGPTALARVNGFFISLIFNFVALYLAYGVLYNYITVTKLHALYLILGLSLFKSIIRVILKLFNNIAQRMSVTIYLAMLFILGTYLFSNLRMMFHFTSFVDIIIFYLIAQAIYEMLAISYTKINLIRMMR